MTYLQLTQAFDSLNRDDLIEINNELDALGEMVEEAITALDKLEYFEKD
jgi:hypothetical protein